MPGLYVSFGRHRYRKIDLLGSLDLDLRCGLLGLKLLGKRQREYALLEARFNLVRVDAFRHLEAALEGAKVAFTPDQNRRTDDPFPGEGSRKAPMLVSSTERWRHSPELLQGF